MKIILNGFAICGKPAMIVGFNYKEVLADEIGNHLPKGYVFATEDELEELRSMQNGKMTELNDSNILALGWVNLETGSAPALTPKGDIVYIGMAGLFFPQHDTFLLVLENDNKEIDGKATDSPVEKENDFVDEYNVGE